MRIVRRIETSGLGPKEVLGLAEEAGTLSAQEYRGAGFH